MMRYVTLEAVKTELDSPAGMTVDLDPVLIPCRLSLPAFDCEATMNLNVYYCPSSITIYGLMLSTPQFLDNGYQSDLLVYNMELYSTPHCQHFIIPEAWNTGNQDSA